MTNTEKAECDQLSAQWRHSTPDQFYAFLELIRQRGWLSAPIREPLEWAASAYALACYMHECCGWLPFPDMPDWENDVVAIIEDEAKWMEQFK
jgi:hypothetical protein